MRAIGWWWKPKSHLGFLKREKRQKTKSFFTKREWRARGRATRVCSKRKCFSERGEHEFWGKAWHKNRGNILELMASWEICTVQILCTEFEEKYLATLKSQKSRKGASLKRSYSLYNPYNVRPMHRNQDRFLYGIHTVWNQSVHSTLCSEIEEVSCTTFKVVFGCWKKDFSVGLLKFS